MSLEEELIVSEFRNQRQKLTVNLIYTHNFIVGKMKKTFKNFGCTIQQFNILRILRGQSPKPSTILLLKNRMFDKQPDVSRLIDRLEGKGWVKRTVNSKDRRKMDILITLEGLSLLDSMEEKVDEFEGFFDSLENEEVVVINELLDKIRDFSSE